MRKRDLIRKIEELENRLNLYSDVIIENNKEISKLNSENKNLNLKYMVLLTKYDKLLKSVSEEETKKIVYNGKLYDITEINHYEKAGEIESIVITANNIPEKEGLVNTMSKTFAEAYDNIKEMLFGNKK